MRFILILVISLCSIVVWSESNRTIGLSYQEALIGVTQVSGFFDRTISTELTLQDVTYLLSSYGVTVNVLKVWRNDPFTEKDMAKMLGQIYILHRGEKKRQSAQIELPRAYEHWVEFCEIHGLDYQVVYRSLLDFFLLKKGGHEG